MTRRYKLPIDSGDQDHHDDEYEYGDSTEKTPCKENVADGHLDYGKMHKRDEPHDDPMTTIWNY